MPSPGLVEQKLVVGRELFRFVIVGGRVSFPIVMDDGEDKMVHIVPQLVFDPEVDRNGSFSFLYRKGMYGIHHALGNTELPRDETSRVLHLAVEMAFQDKITCPGMFPETGCPQTIRFIEEHNGDITLCQGEQTF